MPVKRPNVPAILFIPFHYGYWDEARSDLDIWLELMRPHICAGDEVVPTFSHTANESSSRRGISGRPNPAGRFGAFGRSRVDNIPE